MEQSNLSLYEILSKRTVDKLRVQAKLCAVRGYSRMNKSELTHAVAAAMCRPDVLSEILMGIPYEAWLIFEKTAYSSETVPVSSHCRDSVAPLVDRAFLQAAGGDISAGVWMTAEIKACFDQLCRDGFAVRRARSDLVCKYAAAAVNLYGVITLNDFIALFNQQNQCCISSDEACAYLRRQTAGDGNYEIWNEYLIFDGLSVNEYRDIPDLLACTASIPRYIPGREVFLHYARDGYYEPTIHSARLKSFLLGQLKQDEKAAEELMSHIVIACSVDLGLGRVLDLFDTYHVQIAEKQKKTLITLVSAFAQTVRKWSCNGHTPGELSATGRPNEPVRKKKIGRNAPCPCGSGLKYKKCCGR